MTAIVLLNAGFGLKCLCISFRACFTGPQVGGLEFQVGPGFSPGKDTIIDLGCIVRAEARTHLL